MRSTQFPISHFKDMKVKKINLKKILFEFYGGKRGGEEGGGEGITGEGIIPRLYEEKNAFFTFLFIICVIVENIYHSGDTYTGASSSSVFMPQL